MADRMTAEQRHRCMSHIRSCGTRPEMIVRRWLWHQGYRYRLNVRTLPGKPDIAMRRYRTVIFVNGCFWHGHENCPKYRLPKSNISFWSKKIERNRTRDKLKQEQLRQLGWYVIVVWECELQPAVRQATLLGLERSLSQIFLKINNAEWIEPSDDSAENTSLAAEPTEKYGK